MFETPSLVRRLLGGFFTTAKPVGVWTDGRRVFRKVLTATAGPNSSTVSLTHNLTVTNIQVVKLEAILTKDSDSTVVKAPHISDTEAHSLVLAMSTSAVTLTSGSGGDYSGYAVAVVLEYALTE